MQGLSWVLKFIAATLAVFLLVVLGANFFLNSWPRALLVGAIIYVPLTLALILAHRRRSEAYQKQVKDRGEIEIAGETLRFRDPIKPAISVAASNTVELWYDFNPFGWQSANSFRVVHTSEGQTQQLTIFQMRAFEEPLRSWCIAHLPNFDVATFDSVRGLPGGDEESILLWSRHANAAAQLGECAATEFTN